MRKSIGPGLVLVGATVGIVAACGPLIPATNADGTAVFDIEFSDDATQTVNFGHNIVSTEKDRLFVGADLGLTSLISLAPEFFFKPVGVAARFRSPFAHTQVVPGLDINNCPTTPAKDGCHFVSDAELEMFTRDPTEFYNTLINDPHPGVTFLEDISTARLFPTGEQTPKLNPTPFNMPDVVVMDVVDPPMRDLVCKGVTCFYLSLNQPTLDPVESTTFWLPDNTADAHNLLGPPPLQTLWGTPARNPLGLGSIKGARLVQHAPCEFEVALQGQLDNIKEQVIDSGLNLCNQTFSNFPSTGKVTGLDVRALDAVPFITRAASRSGAPNAFDTEFGILLHGDIQLDATGSIAGVPIATAPCDVQFLFEYRPVVAHGQIVIRVTQHYFEPSGGGVGGFDFKGNVCNYLIRDLVGDSDGNGINGNPPLLTGLVVSKIQGFLASLQGLNLGTAAGFLTGVVGSNSKCHGSSGGNTGGPGLRHPLGYACSPHRIPKSSEKTAC